MKLFLVAGEASGDLHAGNLLVALRRLVPDIEAFGVGGTRLREAGLECIAGTEELSVMGLAEVLRHLPRLYSLARRVRLEAIERRPDLAILVDSPDFNLPLAAHLRRAGIPVVIYVSPQLWAWRSGRVRRIRRDVSRVLCILPFETEFYARHGVAAEYVGHPLVDELASLVAAPPPRRNVLALMPGSRRHEVAGLLPGMLAAARLLGEKHPGLEVRILAAPGLDSALVRSMATGLPGGIVVAPDARHLALAESRVAMVASGTATLECALLGVPMVVGYRLAPLSYAIAKLLVSVPHVALANLVAGCRLVPELVQSAFTPAALAFEVERLLGGAGDEVREGLAEVRRRLGEPGASARAAAAALTVARRTS
jgi:lipid-A-disaccharide synthase